MTRFAAVSACSAEGWGDYGRRMVKTFCEYWPKSVKLTVYMQDYLPGDFPSVDFVDLYVVSPWLVEWKTKRTATDAGLVRDEYNYRRDAVKFSYKTAALEVAVEQLDCDVLIWIDADVFTHSPISLDWLESLFPDDFAVAMLDRVRKDYPETSFTMFRLPAGKQVIDRCAKIYRTDKVFSLPQWHDGYVFGHVMRTDKVRFTSLSGFGRNYSNAFVNSRLGEKMDHLKGQRKRFARTEKKERKVSGGGEYWSG
jgi:hypothetical protein